MRKIILLASLLTLPLGVFASCESGYSIQTKSDDGSLITLDDGSTWRVDGGGQADAAVWVDGDEILVCDDGTFINKDEDNEQVDVELLSR
ncbi:hypothetical protein [Kluyvera intermedia]|jgi:hypothetical protein|uniref:hypothetical protein n=1 Tax=Kluyvera intermedia TaxID=61648 RepID=UPI003525DFBB